jgi:hypothetical protein
MKEYELGSQLRDLLRGLLQVGEGDKTVETASHWGPRLDYRNLRDLYAPTNIKRYTATPGGIDNLTLSSKDTFVIPGKGEFEVDFNGYFRVARSNPTSKSWAAAEWFVNMVDLNLSGESKDLGTINVSLNADKVSPGQVFAAGAPEAAAKCRIATAATFEMPQLGVTAFNKEPILLMNDAIESVPPVEDPNGEAYIYRLPLFNVDDPNGQPIAYLTSLRYTVGNYITREQARAFRGQA